MSNKASDSLHRLIKSLTKPEKRYFKVFSSRHVIGDQNNYLVLFDAIDRQGEYDEAKLIKKFKNVKQSENTTHGFTRGQTNEWLN